MNLVDLVQNAPQINVTVSAADLQEFASTLISQTNAELEQTISDSKAETYLSTEKVLEMFEISPTTLWRWKKRGYIVPVRLGGNDRYKLSDVKKLMEG